jgi:hypothetical protein
MSLFFLIEVYLSIIGNVKINIKNEANLSHLNLKIKRMRKSIEFSNHITGNIRPVKAISRLLDGGIKAAEPDSINITKRGIDTICSRVLIRFKA